MSSMSGSQGMKPRKPKAPSGYKTYEQYTPEQMELFQRMIGDLGPDSFLSKLAGGDEAMFAEMEAPAMRQFSGLLGGLASRFSGMGMGGRRSSGFQNESSAAASNFAQDLQSRRMALQRQAIMDLKGLQSDLLDKEPYGIVEKRQKQSSGWGGLAGAGLGGIGGFFAGGPAGSMTGAQLGYNVGSQF